MRYLKWLRKMSSKVNRIRSMLKDFTLKSGREITAERDDDKQWGLQIKHGDYTVYLSYIKEPPHNSYMIIIVSVKFDENVQRVIKKIYKNPEAKRKFEVGLIEKITSPHTAFRFHYNPDSDIKELVAYEINRKIFPFDKFFSIKDFDEAIQSVVNLLFLSIHYLNALFLSITPQLETASPPPSSMYT